MKFKLDEKGNIVTKDGIPIVIHDDGTEAPYDVLGKISELNQENATRRHEQGTVKKELDAAKADLEAYKGLGTVKEIQTKLNAAEKNQPANEELKDLRAKSAKQEAMIETLQGEVNKAKETETRLNGDIVSLSVGNAFASSKFIQEKTIFTPEVARAVFGSHFKAERKEDGSFQVVGYSDLNDPNPKPIFSRDPKNNGAIASFDEAMEVIFDAYPHKSNYVRGGQDRPGSGGGGNKGDRTPPAGIKLSDLRTDKDRSEFISKHGLKAFKELVDQSQSQGS